MEARWLGMVITGLARGLHNVKRSWCSFIAQMPITFVHLADIHFGQEEGSEIVIHDDVKDRLIEDAAAVAAKAANGRADGVIVSGDIAYAGKSLALGSTA